MALIVKSRRARSASTASANLTSGLRDSGRYASSRWVVISKSCPSLRAPTVPKRLPCNHNASAQPPTMASVSSGRASVVKSHSGRSRPRIASRTAPPTR